MIQLVNIFMRNRRLLDSIYYAIITIIDFYHEILQIEFVKNVLELSSPIIKL